MKLEEAAAILGVTVDTPIDTLKQTYRKLALHWHPDKVIVVISRILYFVLKSFHSVLNQMQKKNFNKFQLHTLV